MRFYLQYTADNFFRSYFSYPQYTVGKFISQLFRPAMLFRLCKSEMLTITLSFFAANLQGINKTRTVKQWNGKYGLKPTIEFKSGFISESKHMYTVRFQSRGFIMLISIILIKN